MLQAFKSVYAFNNVNLTANKIVGEELMTACGTWVCEALAKYSPVCFKSKTYRVYHKDIHPPYSQTGNRYDQTIKHIVKLMLLEINVHFHFFPDT